MNIASIYHQTFRTTIVRIVYKILDKALKFIMFCVKGFNSYFLADSYYFQFALPIVRSVIQRILNFFRLGKQRSKAETKDFELKIPA